MVVSKRCKICAVLDAENIPITGEYFGKLLPHLIVKISGVDLDPRKANGVLICQSCAVQLVQTDLVIDKLRNSLQRLKVLVKVKKPKTPSKDSTKRIIDEKNNNDDLENSDKSDAGENDSQTNLDESKIQIKLKTPKKIARRKSVFPDDKTVINDDISKENGKKNLDMSETGEIDSQTNLEESITQDKTKPKTPKKIARRKSVFPDAKLVNNTDISNENGDTPNSVTTPKFKKILDNEVTPVKNTTAKAATKRKPVTTTNESIQLDEDDLAASTPMKRNKSISLSVNEESPMDLTVDEQDGNESNVMESKVKDMNCIICGKVFHKKSALREHIETSHMGERLKACPHCSSEFRSQQKYESHVFSEKCRTTNNLCQYPKCNKRFKTVHKMELHMQEKHSSQNESEAE
ncbi:zinc finger E-box-binding homeobox 1-like [Calliphora vicina]|uniref:zinc finger E-box-binding homeobox 1-like n=1 Tax=Calliphora vicina TaxID=7373 RepID=UPI00325BB052